jgi:hypothetical protein
LQGCTNRRSEYVQRQFRFVSFLVLIYQVHVA